jgi:hypothetical protein
MLEYTFTCPHCHTNSVIIERAAVIQDTDLLGFNRGYFPEFSVFEESTEPTDAIYVCSNCEQDLGVAYNELYDYVRKHGKIIEETRKR